VGSKVDRMSRKRNSECALLHKYSDLPQSRLGTDFDTAAEKSFETNLGIYLPCMT